MTSPLPPRRRDTTTLADLLRQDRTNLRQLDPGLVGGRFSPAKPPEPFLEDDEEGDDDSGDLDMPLYINTDVTTAAATDQPVTFTLTYEPEPGSLHVRQNGLNLHAAEWSLNGNVVTIPPSPNLHVHASDVFGAAYVAFPPEVALQPEDLPDPPDTNHYGTPLGVVTSYGGAPYGAPQQAAISLTGRADGVGLLWAYKMFCSNSTYYDGHFGPVADGTTVTAYGTRWWTPEVRVTGLELWIEDGYFNTSGGGIDSRGGDVGPGPYYTDSTTHSTLLDGVGFKGITDPARGRYWFGPQIRSDAGAYCIPYGDLSGGLT